MDVKLVVGQYAVELPRDVAALITIVIVTVTVIALKLRIITVYLQVQVIVTTVADKRIVFWGIESKKEGSMVLCEVYTMVEPLS